MIGTNPQGPEEPRLTSGLECILPLLKMSNRNVNE